MAESDLIRGNVDTVILKVLYEGDRYGYDMIKQINAKSGGQWEIKQPTLYACLKRLEKQGFVASYWDASESNGGRRKYYTLTDSGRDVFVSYKNEWERSRDLFGELITGEDSILPVDDFSDVEDDEYEIPKRRPSRPRAKAEKKEKEATVEYVPPAYDETDYIHNIEEADEEPIEESAEAPEPEPEQTETRTEEQQREEFIQQSIFDNSPAEEFLDEDDREEQPEEHTSHIASDNLPSRNYDLYESPDKDEGIGTQPTADPHSIIEEIYASTYTGNRSYSDARAAAYRDENSEKSDAQAAPVTPPAPPAPEAKAEEKPATALQPYSEALPGTTREEESAARREYKDILGELVNRCEEKNANSARSRTAVAEEAATDVAADGRIEIKRFDEVQKAVAELGNEVTVRSHNDSAKQYTHRYYYYSNRLMMTHYTVMCAVMFLLGLILFLSFYVGAGMRMKYDYILYIFAGLLPIVMFIVAVIIFAGNPDKKKRINVNFRFSIIIRIVVMLQAFVIVYCFNLIWGMPVGFSATYVPSLVIPLVYSLFIPVSGGIFMTLLKSGHYNVE